MIIKIFATATEPVLYSEFANAMREPFVKKGIVELSMDRHATRLTDDDGGG